ncbi:TonB-dependent receptor [Sulfurimonas lithotrophica]|uniref:TonB-dependent receptor n=1 Tax=Sulfurimonas lithotrophica TaxID=2590022 RepID=A0A5P8P323_9BACT|nr:TonB-dependent receptor [Sulfurimonas lithotrophica]QFR49987.1 TonB-dependent receptor [Sulfurimonas lithotrophica]
MIKFPLSIALLSSLLLSDVLETIEVTTGTRTAKILSEAPIKTEVVSQEDIEKTHARDISDAIKNIPGLIIKETHGKQGQSVWMQGFDSDRILVLIDGEPMTSSLGSTVDLSQLSTSDIASIEIIKGAASALYGSQAMGGVINIKTKKPKEGLTNKIKIEAGTYADKSPNDRPVGLIGASTSYKTKEYLASAYVDYLHESGVVLNDASTYDLPKRNRINFNSEYRTLGKHQFYIKPRYYYEDTYKPFTSFAPGIGDVNELREEDVNKFRLSMGSESELQNLDKLKTSIFAERYESNSYQDKILTSYVESSRYATIDLVQAETQYDTILNDTHILTMGMQARYNALEQTTTKGQAGGSVSSDEMNGDASAYAVEGYIQDDWFIYDNLEFLPGLRYQYDSDFGSYLSPKLSLFYTPYNNEENRLNIRISYGNGYRVPTIKERYYIFDQSQAGVMLVGNPELEPETSTSYQISTEWIEKNLYSLAINLYYNDIKDLIDLKKNISRSQLEGLDIYEYTNVNKAYTSGFELEFGFKFLNDFSLNGGYTYLYSKDKNTKKHLTSRPENQLKATLAYDTAKLNIQASLTYEGKHYVDSQNNRVSPKQTLADIRFTYSLNTRLKIYGGINNFLDEHEDSKNVDDEGSTKPRYFFIGSSYEF